MSTDRSNLRSWIKAITAVAARDEIAIPPASDFGMGSLSWRNKRAGRLVSFKRRLVPLSEAESSGVEWCLWAGVEDDPECVISFRESLYPTDARVGAVLSLMKGWLLDLWTPAEAKRAVSENADQLVAVPPAFRADDASFWLSEDHSIGIIVRPDSWRISSRTESLASWRARNEEKFGDALPRPSLDRFVVWLAEQWEGIAHGLDQRPPSLQHRGATASRAYEYAQQDQSANTPEVQDWWSKHAIRAADKELPNVFFERQGDELLISWDAMPSQNRFYRIYPGEAVAPVAFAVPALRRLVHSRLRDMQLAEPERLRLEAVVSNASAVGYAALSCHGRVTQAWLNSQGFSDLDAEQVALAGTSRHPVVGLLRSSYGTSINVLDYELVLRMLHPSDDNSFAELRSLAMGINAHVDAREPWESGYRLAQLAREKLKLKPADNIDVESQIRTLGVDICDANFSDPIIRGVCVGTPAYKPLIIINNSSPNASGHSGRRITLAHELCHLLFDRSRLRNLARFDWDAAENDRLLEMRANAFAVELLVPMDLLVKPDGQILEEADLRQIASSRSVSIAALNSHVQNLKNRLLAR